MNNFEIKFNINDTVYYIVPGDALTPSDCIDCDLYNTVMNHIAVGKITAIVIESNAKISYKIDHNCYAHNEYHVFASKKEAFNFIAKRAITECKTALKKIEELTEKCNSEDFNWFNTAKI